MGDIELILALIAAVALLAELASLLRIPYPIVLVVGGLVIGLTPGLPEVELEPDLILLVFLPPLLQAAAFATEPRALRRYAQPIASLAIGLVIATVFAVALIGHLVIGLPWEIAVVLGAIVAPTDPVAAEAVFRRLRVPPDVRTVVGGESLVNDGLAVVIYQLAVAVAIGETVSMLDAVGTLALVGGGGVVLGLVLGRLVFELWVRLRETVTFIVATAVTPYLIYIAAEELHLSGILAVVASGLYLGWRSPELPTASPRIQMNAFWGVFEFLLNAVLFVLVGLVFSSVLDSLGARVTAELVGYAALAAATVFGMRLVYFATVPHVRTRISTWLGAPQEIPPWRNRLIAGWSGMRGGVALALALAVPLQANGAPFPDRDVVIFVAYIVILATILVPGLSLASLIRALGVEPDDTAPRQEQVARLAAAEAALERFEQVCETEAVPRAAQERMRELYEGRIERLQSRLAGSEVDGGEQEERSAAWRAWRRELLTAERQRVLDLRNRGEISSDVLRKIEHDLDLEEARWS